MTHSYSKINTTDEFNEKYYKDKLSELVKLKREFNKLYKEIKKDPVLFDEYMTYRRETNLDLLPLTKRFESLRERHRILSEKLAEIKSSVLQNKILNEVQIQAIEESVKESQKKTYQDEFALKKLRYFPNRQLTHEKSLREESGRLDLFIPEAKSKIERISDNYKIRYQHSEDGVIGLVLGSVFTGGVMALAYGTFRGIDKLITMIRIGILQHQINSAEANLRKAPIKDTKRINTSINKNRDDKFQQTFFKAVKSKAKFNPEPPEVKSSLYPK